MRLAGVAMMLTIALIITAATQARENRATEQAMYQAHDVIQGVDQALKGARNAGKQGADQTEEKGEEKGAQETTVVTTPESGGISTGNIALSAVGGSALVIGLWHFAHRGAR